MKLIYSTIAVLVILTSCQKVVDINLNDGGATLVIDAAYDASNQITTAKLSYTGNYFGNDVSPEIAGAVVTIEDANGVTYPLSYVGESTYSYGGLVPEFESNYTMKVSQDGVDYSATSFLAPFVPLDTMIALFQEASAFGEEGYLVFLGISDQANYNNYFRGAFSVNGYFLNPAESGIFYFDDSFTEDNYFTIPLFTERFSLGDTVECEFRSINADRNLYLSGLEDVLGGNTAAPTNPVSNWDNDALGFFNVYSQNTKQIIIQ